MQWERNRAKVAQRKKLYVTFLLIREYFILCIYSQEHSQLVIHMSLFLFLLCICSIKQSIVNYWVKNCWMLSSVQFSSFQALSHIRLFVTPWIAARQASLSITSSWSPPKLMSIQSVMPSSHLILCCPLLLLLPIPPSIRVSGGDQWVNSSHEVAKVLEFQLQHQSFQWTPRTDHL